MGKDLVTIAKHAPNIHTLWITPHVRASESITGLKKIITLLHAQQPAASWGRAGRFRPENTRAKGDCDARSANLRASREASWAYSAGRPADVPRFVPRTFSWSNHRRPAPDHLSADQRQPDKRQHSRAALPCPLSGNHHHHRCLPLPQIPIPMFSSCLSHVVHPVHTPRVPVVAHFIYTCSHACQCNILKYIPQKACVP